MGEYLTQRLRFRCKVLSLEDLCIVSGRSCWVLYIDIVCLNFDGNIFDASLLSVSAALRSTRLPLVCPEYLRRVELDDVSGSGDDVRVVRGESAALPLQHTLLSASFVLLDGVLLADATAEEEQLSSCSITVVLNEARELCGVYKPGGTVLSQQHFEECVRIANKRVATLLKLLGKQ